MKVNPFIFRGYDIRGLVDIDLNPEIVELIGRAYGAFLLKRKINRAVVGRDCRLSSQPYAEAVIKGLLSAGVDVIDIGLALAGTTYWAQYYFKAKGCVSVSGSHNPVEYNGFKMGTGFSKTTVTEEIEELRQTLEAGKFPSGSGRLEKKDIKKHYLDDLLEKFVLPLKFKVVVDPGYATAGLFAPELLEKAGCQVVCSHCEIDGSFPLGAPDPTEKKMAERLSQKVLETGADIGFSYDSDGDRIGIVDNRGNIIWNDVLLALFASIVLEENPKAKIVFNALCSKVVQDIIIGRGGIPMMWRTGHSFIKDKAQKEKAPFAGELSGHFYFLDRFYPHDDGLYSTLALLNYLSRVKKSLAEVIEKFPEYVSSPEIKIGCPDEKKVGLISEIAERLRRDFPGASVIDDERVGDGVRVEFDDQMFIIRYSQNAPYLTIKFEARTAKNYAFLKDYISRLLHEYKEVDWMSKNNINLDSLS